MGHREFKDQLYAEFARIGKALASPQRLELLDLLAQGERTVENLAAESAITVANASQHLHVLRGARLVESRKEGLYVYYRLADPAVFALWRALRTVGERQLAEIDRLVEAYMRHPEHLEPLSREELAQRLALEYEQGHIAGAQSIPVEQMEARLRELNPHQEVVAYCRGPYCVFADEAVTLLRAQGFTARRYAEGYPEWAAAGLPIEREPVTSAADQTAHPARKSQRQ
jgi:DNA-binding transcriptional ArsR family regulator/rhodanese-related sulfurtransferase